MPEIHETAYPRLNSSVTDKDLKEIYTPLAEEISLASEVARGRNAKLYFLVLLKTFQRLGYFIQLRDVPRRIVSHVASQLGLLPFDFDVVAYCVIFHNVQAMTRILHELTEEGITYGSDVLSRLSLYLTEHINRFGNYTLDLNRMRPSPRYEMPFEAPEFQATG